MTIYVPPTADSIRRKGELLRAIDRADRDMLEAALPVALMVSIPGACQPERLQVAKDRFVSMRNQYLALLEQLDEFELERSRK